MDEKIPANLYNTLVVFGTGLCNYCHMIHLNTGPDSPLRNLIARNLYLGHEKLQWDMNIFHRI